MLEILQKCPNAKLYTSLAFDSETFLNVLEVSKKNYSPKSAFAGFKEIQLHLKKTGRQFNWLKADSIIYRNVDSSDKNSRVIALSPNDQTINYFYNKIGGGIKAFKILSKRTDPNLTSIALLVTVDNQSVLLSSDLERTDSEGVGLDSILSTYELKEKKNIILFKIPHHGSENGYSNSKDTSLWSKLIEKNNVFIGTPFNRLKENAKLPTAKMTEVINDYSTNSFITSNPRTKKNRKKIIKPKIPNRNPLVTKELKKLGLESLPLIKDVGVIRSIISKDSIVVELSGSSIRYSDLLSSHDEED